MFILIMVVATPDPTADLLSEVNGWKPLEFFMGESVTPLLSAFFYWILICMLGFGSVPLAVTGAVGSILVLPWPATVTPPSIDSYWTVTLCKLGKACLFDRLHSVKYYPASSGSSSPSFSIWVCFRSSVIEEAKPNLYPWVAIAETCVCRAIMEALSSISLLPVISPSIAGPTLDEIVHNLSSSFFVL